MLDEIKKRCYITSDLFDDEIKSLINACIRDLKDVNIDTSNLDDKNIDKIDGQLLNCIVNYVKAYRGNDRTDTEQYLKMYESLKNKLSLQESYEANNE